MTICKINKFQTYMLLHINYLQNQILLLIFVVITLLYKIITVIIFPILIISVTKT